MTQKEQSHPQSSKLIHSIYAAAPIGIGMTVNRIIVNANEYLLKMTGYNETELLGQSARILYADDREFARVGEIKFSQIAKCGIGSVETVWRHRSGRPINIILSSAPIDPSDLSKGVTFTAQDITERKQIETELRERETQLRTFIETADDIVCFKGLDQHVAILNTACLKITGYSLEEFNSNPYLWSSIVHPDDLRESDLFFKTHPEGIIEHEMTYRILNKSGHWRWLHSRMTAARDSSGSIIGYNCVDHDTSDQKAFEEQTRSRAEHMKVHHAALLSLAKTHFDSFNGALDAILEMCSSTLHVDRVSYWIYPEDHSRIECRRIYIRSETRFDSGFVLMASDYPIYFQSIQAARVLAAHDSSTDPRIADFLTSYCQPLGIGAMLDVPVWNQGRIIGILCLEHVGPARTWTPEEQDFASSISDIISVNIEVFERQNAEKMLQDSKARSRLFLNSTPDCVFLKDSSFRYIFVNDAMVSFLQLRESDILNRTDFEILPNDLAQVCRETDTRALETPEIVVTEEQHGAKSYESIKFGIILNDGSHGLGGYLRDITEKKQVESTRRQLEIQMQHTQKLESLGVLAGGIAHDFNNLLLTILGNADLALCDIPVTHPARISLDGIVRGAQRAAELCRQMLAYSGKGRFIIQSININDLILEMTHLLDVSISKKAKVHLNLSGTLPAIEADSTQIRQIIMNLITNASEALNDRTGIICVSTGSIYCTTADLQSTYLKDDLPEGDYVVLEVSDTGVGMDRGVIDRIFEPFFSTKFTGRGLGLAAVLGIVRGHFGAIKVASEPGKGTSIRVFLPASALTAGKSTLHSESAIPDWTGSGTILLTDDDTAILSVTRRMLDKLGFSVLTAHDGLEALDRFEQYRNAIDCVILDLTMPNMDGIETFRRLQQMKPGIRIIMSSGYNEQDVTQRFAGQAFSGFIQKPYRFEELSRTLQKLFSQ